MTLLALSQTEKLYQNVEQRIVGDLINKRLGGMCDIILDFDEPDSDFSYLIGGTTLSLLFDSSGITVLDLDLETGEDNEIGMYLHEELDKVIDWLLTQVS